MINEDFRGLINEKIKNLEKEKRKLQITQESEKLKQIENQQQALYTMKNYPLSFASSKSSNEEIEYIINLYRTDIEANLERVNQGINKLMEEWTDANFLNEVAVYTIFNIINSNNVYELKKYLDLLEKSRNNADNLYDINSIYKIIDKKFPNFPNIIDLTNHANIFEIVVQYVKNFESSFKSKFEDKVIKYYDQYVARNKQLSLPFSEDVRLELSKSIAPLLREKNILEEKLENYKNMDLNDEKNRKKYVDEIIRSTYQTYTGSLPFYVSYDLDKFDKLFRITGKINNADDKGLLLETIKEYKKQLEDKSQYSEKKEYQSRYQSKYDRFEDINQMLHMGDYSEGDTVDYFSVFLHHTLNKMGIPFCNSYEYIDTLTKRQFDTNDKLIEEVKQKLEKSVEESGIKSQIEQYEKLEKSLISKMHKARIKSLEEEINNKISSIVMSIRNSYAKEGYQLFKELPFLKLLQSPLYRTSEGVTLEEVVEKDNNMLFNANYITVDNTMRDVLDNNGYTLNDAMGLKKVYNENFEDNMQKLQGTISQMIKGNITEEEILFLCGLAEEELKQITEENALLKMQTLREIMVKYNELDDKTLVNDDYKTEMQGFGR